MPKKTIRFGIGPHCKTKDTSKCSNSFIFVFDSIRRSFHFRFAFLAVPTVDGQKKVQEEQKLLFPKAKAEMIKKMLSINRKTENWGCGEHLRAENADSE